MPTFTMLTSKKTEQLRNMDMLEYCFLALQEDGNYQVDPPTGFWPDYMDYFMKHFRAEYGSDIKLERVWMDNNMGTEMVLAGIVHMTEPYYIYEGLSLGKEPKKWSHDFSAIIMGYEQQFMTLKF